MLVDPAGWPGSFSEASGRVGPLAAVALVDHARAERPGLDQVQREILGGRRHQTSANAAPSSLSRIDGSVSHTSVVEQPAAAEIAAELAFLLEMEPEELVAGSTPSEPALAVGDEPSTDTLIE